jgi:glycosyltransferase involved in cell wall biosynthesis
LTESVIVTGPVPDADLAALYSGATVFAFLGLHEGFGLPPVEAMACGTPVVVANRASLPEVVADAGLLVDPLDQDAIAGALARVLDDAALRGHMRQRGHLRAAAYAPTPIARDVVRVYDECRSLARRREATV